MDISAPSKEALMEGGIPPAGAGPIGFTHCDSEAFLGASAPDAEAFAQISASMEAPKDAAISRERHGAGAGVLEKSVHTSREPFMMSTLLAPPPSYYCRKGRGRPFRQIESKKRTFERRRNRLFKDAYELSVLCDADVGAIIFSPSGKMSEFASSRSYTFSFKVDVRDFAKIACLLMH